MTNKRMKVVMTDYDYPSLNLERKVLEEIDADFVGAHCATEEEVITVAKYADGILNQYAPITEETKHAFGKGEFKAMKKDAYLINTARGPLLMSLPCIGPLKKDGLLELRLSQPGVPWWIKKLWRKRSLK